MTDRTDTRTGWLAPDEIADARDRLPIIYVNAVPVRINATGEVTHVGLLLRAAPDGTISRAVVSGRILYGERVRDALLRHLEKDLGPVALPRLPLEPQPFTVAEYFPDAERHRLPRPPPARHQPGLRRGLSTATAPPRRTPSTWRGSRPRRP